MRLSLLKISFLLTALAVGAGVGWAHVSSLSTISDDSEFSALPASEEPDQLPVRTLDIPSTVIKPQCDVLGIIRAGDSELEQIPLKVGTKRYRHYEVLGSVLDFTDDYEKDIALRVLDLDTCATRVVVVQKTYETATLSIPVKNKKGIITWHDQQRTVARLVPPDGWTVELVQRVNDLYWNGAGSQIEIRTPINQAVIRVRYPVVKYPDRKGDARIEYRIQTAYSEPLRIDQLIIAGPLFQRATYNTVLENLRRQEVPSHAVRGRLVADVLAERRDLLELILPIEHTDPTEFGLDQRWAFDRVFVLIGANNSNMGKYVCSPVGACGAHQFMPDTWREVAIGYPEAKLPRDFQTGARDMLFSATAAALYVDTIMKTLSDKLGPQILEHPQLNEMIMASYNTGPNRVANVVAIAQKQGLAEWTEAKGKKCSKATRYAECLLTETKGYVAKYRYVHDLWPQEYAALLSTVGLR